MPFGYKVTVRPQHERQAAIQAQAAASSRKDTSHIVYEGTPTQLTVIRVPLNLPVYRMENGRTQTQQLSYIAQNNLPATYFEAGEENESVQQIQHDILKIFVNEKTDSLTPISEELERTKQTEPLLITPSGVVVNGNRRLCAMRELYTERPAEFASFATVECAVLPPLTPEQVEDVEIRLQMTPETKLQYGWVDECLKIQRLLDKGRSEGAIADLMRQGVTALRKSLQAQKYAEIYLRDWRKKPKDYQQVHSGQQFFNDLVGRLKSKSGELLEANLRIAWILFDNRTVLGGRIYNFNQVVGDRAPEVLSSLAERLDVEEGTPAEDEEDAEDLDIDLGEDATAPSTPYGPLIKVLDDETRRVEVTDHLKAVCQTIIDAKQTIKLGSSALTAVREAHSRLVEVDLTGANPKTYAGIDRQLEEVIHTATELKARLQEYRAGTPAAEEEAAS